MQLNIRDSEDFTVTLNLNINYELKYIETTVTARNKKANTVATKRFSAEAFADAIDYFEQQRQFLFGSN